MYESRLHYYKGGRTQRGHGLGSLFRKLFRSFRPLLKTGGRYIAKKGLNLGYNTLNDTLAGQDFKSSLRKRFRDTRSDMRQDVNAKLRRIMKGRGKRRKKSKKNKKGKNKRVNKKKKKSTKRRKSSAKKTSIRKKKRKSKTKLHVHGDLF